jgi:alpha-L-fucosidase 2
VFPALPATWRDVAFSTLRAEGAFLVSAVRRDGRTTRVTVTSLAGEPARLRMAMDRPRVSAARAGSVRRAGDGEWILALRPEESVTFTARDVPEAATTIGPVTAQSGPANAFGRR